MCGSMVDIHSATAEIRRGKKIEDRKNHRNSWNRKSELLLDISICISNVYFGIQDAGIEALACARHFTMSTSRMKVDGCIVWNAHNTVVGEKQVGMERPSNIIISLHRKIFSIITNI